ncbi:MAG: shikimate kinase [Oscillospiraceae bacterium]|jgi:shikimate dehydrogenase|nr:shikimate kinase [Oscillospiraceae bacterium]MCI9588768.1 shikimate kinase [Oscillospiraceae bacterium]
MDYGLIGARLGHSHSPRIHAALAGYNYQLRELKEEELAGFLTERAFRGINVTIPYKKAVMPFCAELGEGARRIGCVNTIVKRSDGSLYGDNTDYYGFCQTARRAGVTFAGRHVLILGSGGTSLTAFQAAEDLGAASVERVSRSGELNYETVYQREETEIVVNTTPVGMFPKNGERAVDLSRFPRLQGVVDVVYNPLRTAFLLQAAALGVPAAGGLPMLVAQARRASELFTGERIPEERMEAVLREVAAEVTSVVLIGMPGSGKSTVGAALARRLERPFVDADEEIVRRAGRSIPEIFAEDGEERFRTLETEVLSDLGKRSGIVLATGGGAVLFERNLPLLRQNGRIYRITRDVSRLATCGRPLSSSPERLREMERERAPFYERAADVTVSNDGSTAETVAAIMRDLREEMRI